MDKLDNVIFYNLEKAVKSYRQFAQANCLKAGVEITIDQWLVLKTIGEYPDITQHQLAGRIFKDVASVTRMIELLVTKDLLFRKSHAEDRRRFTLTLSDRGRKVLELMRPISLSNRRQALEGVTETELQTVQGVLQKIIHNVSKEVDEKTV
ncbi:MAG TPA: MarR family transcriptional regulator [Mucilaginibacter sp.]|nr:MarR family transcriptional regulator [Mucilaginibacter sp.]